MRILALGGGLHDLAACVVEDGRLVLGIEQERLTRVRHACDHPRLTECFHRDDFRPYRVWAAQRFQDPEVDYCLNGGTLKDFDLVTHAVPLWGSMYRFRRFPPEWLLGRIKGMPSHHLAHAASAFLVSPYEEAAVLVVDSFGSPAKPGFETSSIWHGRGTELKLVRMYASERVGQLNRNGRWPPPGNCCSLGVFYSDVTTMCGFNVLDAGKTMGLAPWGGLDRYPALSEYVHLAPGGAVQVDMRYLEWLDRQAAEVAAAPTPEEKFRIQAEVARAAQQLLEEAILHLARFAHEQTGCRRICLAGGVALNAVANSRILQETPFQEIYIQPAANDAGLGIGAAFYHYYKLTGRQRDWVMEHVYLGREYSQAEMIKALQERAGRLEWQEVPDAPAVAAALVAEGNLVAWYQGGAEYGPRALGNRSILGDPRRKEMWQKANQVKAREWFRPLAPSVLAEYQSEYFQLGHDALFMILVAQVRPEKRDIIPATVHVDGSARLHTVRRDLNPRYYDLIEHFRRLTGVPVVLNTSFNVKGPIVETPAEACDTFLGSELDRLVMGNYVVTRRAGTP